MESFSIFLCACVYISPSLVNFESIDQYQQNFMEQ